MDYESAVRELYQAPLADFIGERKRLAAELKAAGDKDAAKQLGERAKPPVSAWVVNQLYWHARDAMDDLLATADRLRKGDLAATSAHRDALAKLRQRAAALLGDAGHTATEATLRRVTTTLSAIAATGGWDPDPPGALSADRDPPGFEAVGIVAPPPPKPHPPAPPAPRPKKPAEPEGDKQAEREQREAEREAKRREEEARAKLKAQRHKLETAMREAKAELADKERELRAVHKQIEKLEREADKAREAIDSVQRELDDLDATN